MSSSGCDLFQFEMRDAAYGRGDVSPRLFGLGAALGVLVASLLNGVLDLVQRDEERR